MSIQFLCSACGQPIEVDDDMANLTVTCPYCRNSVIVPDELHNPQPEANPHSRLDELILPQIRDLLARNQKIDAIK